MKKLFLISSCLLTLGCLNSKDAKKILPPEMSKTQPEELCFLSVTGETVKDSLIMSLEMDGKNVSGTYDWLPAEKDSRTGNLSGTISGNSIKGKYVFMQEGMEQTQPINIELHNDFAKVTTNAGKPDKMVVEIEKVECE